MYQAVIGLEVHLQLNTRTKMFSACAADYFGHEPNSFTDPLTMGLPGTLPVINRRAVELALMFGLALNCEVEGFTQFHRKNYFYPDAPKNYQISQYDRPIARHGFLMVGGERVGIRRAHLEDDAGKLIHPMYAPYSLLDLNRAGMPLIEMVTEPDIRSPEQAREFLNLVRAIAQALGVSDANPEEGKMRCDVNVSLHRPGEPWGTKVEVKNLNSFKSVGRSLEYEIARQTRVLQDGGRVTQDTMGWDEGGGRTFVMRTKEGEADYRYFPEPDLPPLNITREWVERVRARMGELPAQKRARFVAAGIKDADAETLSLSVSHSRFLDDAMTTGADAQKLANWLLGDVSGWLAARDLELSASALTPANLAALVKLIDAGTISGRIAKDLLPEVMAGVAPERLVNERGLAVVTDTDAIEAAVEKIMAASPEVVERVRGGNAKAVNALFGPIMKELGGKAQPELVRDVLLRKLSENQAPA
ncbi:Asp-tRNA(Asn)/Glu-tRNA(Gln) amidotransferase subunit GatB [Deinococcus peraridilitoris]|uniref:Aspartyl/glutamyl-tRNA(Asn/Gln) amidotransferase subunit B n=1 Tax=Deinococcus peraridilitoris (strain DSM 19664 / LMG 22246 / CIP 109416 / KR-200) TaxID=937777 RepID=L0A0G0_DEIPD|nr:Asp-tRNA(Asn)/Glu-tRNA(Gln) amidotransferase subunit GatB [Deinococcus peraridilitoris]AFZ67383.1 glutamyl-tRNA(Gln) and/or aspartyl-tRNA(Asn) amidotransferase, B subunit [Deinococcus peraridilitoris DSM 19664]